MGIVSRLATHIPPAAVAPALAFFSDTELSPVSLGDSPSPSACCWGLCPGISPPVGSSLLPAGHCDGHWTLPLMDCPFELGVTFGIFWLSSLAFIPSLGLPVFTCYWHCLSRPPPCYGGSRLAASLLSLFGRDRCISPYLPRCVHYYCQITMLWLV